MSESSQKRPPIYTASIGLFLQTLCILSLIVAGYVWYLPTSDTIVVGNVPKQTIKKVTPKDNLLEIVKGMSDYTTLEFEAGKYQQKLVIPNLKGIILQSLPNQHVILESVEGIAVDWNECSQGKMIGLTIRTHDSKSPALNFNYCRGITLENVNIQAEEIAIRSRFDCENIFLYGKATEKEKEEGHPQPNQLNTIQGQIWVEKCQGFVLKNYHWNASKNSYAGIFEEVTNLHLENNTIQSEQGIQLKKVQANEQNPNTIIQNKIQLNRDGIYVLDYSSHLRIMGNEIITKQGPALAIMKSNLIHIGKDQEKQIFQTDVGLAMLIAQSSQIQIIGCWYKNKDSRNPAIAITTGSENITLTQNTISGLHYLETKPEPEIKGGGILIQNGNSITLMKNKISESENYGLKIENQSQVQLIGNYIQENLGNGVEVADSQITSGTQNYIQQNDMAGLVMKNSEGMIYENQISHNHKDGIILENSKPILETNTIANNQGDGLVIRQNSSPIIKRNEIHNNKGFGISFGRQNQKVDWKNNTLSNNKQGSSDDTSTKNEPLLPLPTQPENTKKNENMEPKKETTPKQEKTKIEDDSIWETIRRLEGKKE